MSRCAYCVAFLVLGMTISAERCKPPRALQVPPPGTYYHGVYPGGTTGWEDDITPADLDSYVAAAGRDVAWVYFSNNWFSDRNFPSATVGWIRERGAVPYIRLMLRSDVDQVTGPDPTFSLEEIVAGTFDVELEAWGREAARHGPLIVEWGTEMNGDWFAWNGVWHGGAGQGPALFRQAFRHIVERINRAGAEITWVFHVNAAGQPASPWNAFENYYPGDDVVDWIGVSSYGAQTPLDTYWDSLAAGLDQAMPRLAAMAPAKPIFLVEFAVSAGNPLGDPNAWAGIALSQILSGRWPALRGFSWWNETWQNDNDPTHDTEMRIQHIPGMPAVFQASLSNSPRVVDRPILARWLPDSTSAAKPSAHHEPPQVAHPSLE